MTDTPKSKKKKVAQDLEAYTNHLPPIARAHSVFFSEEKATEIVDLYMSGLTLMAISKEPNMPSYGGLLGWAKNNESFRNQLQACREVRALHYEDSAITAAEEAEYNPRKDAAALGALKFQAYKWAAEVNDSTRYGKKTTISGDAKNPVMFQIITGVPAPEAHQQPAVLAADGTIKKDIVLDRKHDHD